jgi:hypothetical protein
VALRPPDTNNMEMPPSLFKKLEVAGQPEKPGVFPA